eukprot:3357984-Rhodomonas_salina.2
MFGTDIAYPNRCKSVLIVPSPTLPAIAAEYPFLVKSGETAAHVLCTVRPSHVRAPSYPPRSATMSGTGIAYDSIALSVCYEMSGTAIA